MYVLDISKIEAGGLELDLAPVDIAELVVTCADLFSLQAQEKGVRLCLDLDKAGGQRVMLDRLRVGQILHNLISNAIKFTSVGEIRVSARLEKHASSKTGILYLSVADTGVGMDDITRNRVFRPYRSEEHTSELQSLMRNSYAVFCL